MRRHSRRNGSTEDEQLAGDDTLDVSPVRSQRSTTSQPTSLHTGVEMAGTREDDDSPSKGLSSGSPVKIGGNRKTLKIGANVRFRGDVMECDTVILCGRLEGFVEARCLSVREGGSFVGDAKAEDVDVYGSVEGSLESTSKICVRSSGSMCGTVLYQRMSMEEGGEIEGVVESMRKRALREAQSSSEGDQVSPEIAAKVEVNPEPRTPPRAQSPLPGIEVPVARRVVTPPRIGGDRTALQDAASPVSANPEHAAPRPIATPQSTKSRNMRNTPVGSGAHFEPSPIRVRSASPARRMKGLQEVKRPIEASEVFGSMPETPPGVARYISQSTPEPSKTSRTPPARSKPVEVPNMKDGNSVAARIGTWPPLSPSQSKPPVYVPKRLESGASTPTHGIASTPTRTGTPSSLPQPTGEASDVCAVVVEETSAAPADELQEASSPTIHGSGNTKACEARGCFSEAYWGDPRFRPRYCARHKRQGNKLMDPVETEEGDDVAVPEGSSPPVQETSLVDTTSATNDCTEEPLETETRSSSSAGDTNNGGKARSTVPNAFAATSASLSPKKDSTLPAECHASTQDTVGVDAGADIDDEEEDLEDDEDEDEGWDGSGVILPNGHINGSGVHTAPALANGRLVVEGFRVGNDDGRTGVDGDKEGDVLATVARFERMSKKTPGSKAKATTPKPKKRASASSTNIADFYGRGGESESDDDETTSYSSEVLNRGLLLPGAEVGTYTEDGQLRPQASQARDQQRLAHLVRVGKLGSALRGKGVSMAGKRR